MISKTSVVKQTMMELTMEMMWMLMLMLMLQLQLFVICGTILMLIIMLIINVIEALHITVKPFLPQWMYMLHHIAVHHAVLTGM
jgi:hypothetical protein